MKLGWIVLLLTSDNWTIKKRSTSKPFIWTYLMTLAALSAKTSSEE
jgi:hypothetical protein